MYFSTFSLFFLGLFTHLTIEETIPEVLTHPLPAESILTSCVITLIYYVTA